jgi:hypothetical protein
MDDENTKEVVRLLASNLGAIMAHRFFLQSLARALASQGSLDVMLLLQLLETAENLVPGVGKNLGGVDGADAGKATLEELGELVRIVESIRQDDLDD